MPRQERLRKKGDSLIAVIGDEDTVTGFLLSGIGDIDMRKNKNFFSVLPTTTITEIENAFRDFTTREDIAIVLITQTIAEDIRYLLEDFDSVVPTVLEIPSKENPYDPSKDSVMQRVMLKLGLAE